MSLDPEFIINRYAFNSDIFTDIQHNQYAKNLWPIVYIISDGKLKEAYVGETADTFSRMSSHLKSNPKSKLSTVHLIASDKFNKSATLDIESNLIKYISGDGTFKLLNGNIGLANHNYYQKNEVYWDLFKEIWNKLRADGISKHPIEFIDNSDLFKYSPYKTLSKDQKEGLLVILKSLLDENYKNILVEGGAGTGKTVLAIFIFKLLLTNNEDFNFKEFGDDETEFIQTILDLKIKYPNPKMALVVPMSSFRNTLKNVFKNIKGLKASMVIGPADLANDSFDIIFVDESHRLRRRINLGAYFKAFDVVCNKLGLKKGSASELDWVLQKSKSAILFYDEKQSIKPSDVENIEFLKLKSASTTKVEKLQSQFRVKGGKDYVKYIDDLLNCKLKVNASQFHVKEYEFLLFDSIQEMVDEIKSKNLIHGLSRLVAGYSWPWISKKNKKLFDINIENVKLQWNSVSKDFINSTNAINEVGCIHTTQGYDLNFSGIIFGKEIGYDKINDEIIIYKNYYFDRNGKQSIDNPDDLKSFILNIYKTIMLRGIKGTYVYACDPNLREYFSNHINSYRSNNTTVQVSDKKLIPFENSIPFYSAYPTTSNFLDLQNHKFEAFDWIEVESHYMPFKDLFACKVHGHSMNKIIPDGSICLFRKFSEGNNDGKIVLVEHNLLHEAEYGSGYTVKEYHRNVSIGTDNLSHISISLKPLSNDLKYRDILIQDDQMASLKVIGTFEGVLQ